MWLFLINPLNRKEISDRFKQHLFIQVKQFIILILRQKIFFLVIDNLKKKNNMNSKTFWNSHWCLVYPNNIMQIDFWAKDLNIAVKQLYLSKPNLRREKLGKIFQRHISSYHGPQTKQIWNHEIMSTCSKKRNIDLVLFYFASLYLVQKSVWILSTQCTCSCFM